MSLDPGRSAHDSARATGEYKDIRALSMRASYHEPARGRFWWLHMQLRFSGSSQLSPVRQILYDPVSEMSLS